MIPPLGGGKISMVTLGKPNIPAPGSANTTRTVHVNVSVIDEFMSSLNEQFPQLVEGEKPAYTVLYAFQSEPKGNITVWNAKKGVHTVTLTGSLSTLAI